MTGLYPIIRRKRVPLAIAAGQLPMVEPKPAGGGQMPAAGCLMPDTGATQARTPAPLPQAEAPVPAKAAGGKEHRAKRQD
jgi:hypothetical protein